MDEENEKREEIIQKGVETQKRKANFLQERKGKARGEVFKAQEVAFLLALEQESKRVLIDEKLRTTHLRRKEILQDIRKKQKDYLDSRKAKLARREEIIQDKHQQLLKQKIDKQKDAEKRR